MFLGLVVVRDGGDGFGEGSGDEHGHGHGYGNRLRPGMEDMTVCVPRALDMDEAHPPDTRPCSTNSTRSRTAIVGMMLMILMILMILMAERLTAQ